MVRKKAKRSARIECGIPVCREDSVALAVTTIAGLPDAKLPRCPEHLSKNGDLEALPAMEAV